MKPGSRSRNAKKLILYKLYISGGWCIDEPRILGTVYEGKSSKCVYNGVPEWNYEEEMLSTNNAIWWSPDSKFFAFLAFDVSNIDLLEYSVKGSESLSSDILLVNFVTSWRMGNIIIRNHKNTTSKVVYKWFQNIVKGSPRDFLPN